MEIRPMCLADVEALAKLEREIFSDPWSLRDFEKLLDYSYSHYLVATEDGRIVGFAGMLELCKEGNIDKVMVDAPYRGRGIAKALLRALFARGEELGVTAYTLEVRAGNFPAIHVYEELGFAREGVRPGFYDNPREDAVIMWRR